MNRAVTALTLAGALALQGCGKSSEADLLEAARTANAHHEYRTAVINLKAVLQKNASSGEARYLLGDVLLNTGDAAGALVELNKSLELGFNRDMVTAALARGLLLSGDPRKLIASYGDVHLATPAEESDLRGTLAAAYVAVGELAPAKQAVAAALAAEPGNVTAQLLNVRLVAGDKQTDGALTLLDKVLAQKPNEARAWTLKGELLWSAKKDISGGIDAFRQALKVDAHHMRAYTALLQLYLEKNDDAAFRAQVAELIKQMPQSFEAGFYRAQLELLDGNLKAAQDSAQQLLKVAGDYPPVLQLAGTVSMRRGEWALAQAYLTKAVYLAPTVPVSRQLLAQTQLRLGQPARALTTLRPLLDETPPGADVLRLAGEAHLQDNNLQRAQAFFMQAVQVQPDDLRAQVALALTDIAKGDGKKGLADLDHLATTSVLNDADLALITTLMQRNDLEGALKAAERLQRKQPTLALAPLLRGRILGQLKRADQSRAAFEEAGKVDPDNFTIVEALAASDLQRGRVTEARQRYETFLQRRPKDAAARVALASLRSREGAPVAEVDQLLLDNVRDNGDDVATRLALVQHYLGTRRAKAALAAAQEASAMAPDNLQVLDALGRAQLDAGDTQQALNTFQRISASDAATPELLLRLTDAYASMRSYDLANTQLQRALQLSPRNLAVEAAMVRLAMLRARMTDALAVVHQVQKERPQEAVGFVMEGELQVTRQAWDPALKAFRSALERDPRNTELAKRLHAGYSLAGRSADADRFAAEWNRQTPNDVEFLFHLGSMASERKDQALAETRFRQVLALQPDNAASMNNLALALVRQGKPGAVAMAEKANQVLPEQAAIEDTLAAAYAAEKQLPKALDWQRKAVAHQPDAADYRLNLAKLLIASGDKEQARGELDKLTALGGRYGKQAEVAGLLKSL